MMTVMRLLWHVTQASDTAKAKKTIHETDNINETCVFQTHTNIMFKDAIWCIRLTFLIRQKLFEFDDDVAIASTSAAVLFI